MIIQYKNAVSALAVTAMLTVGAFSASAAEPLRPVRQMSAPRHGVYEAVAPASAQPQHSLKAARIATIQPRVGATPGFIIDSQFEGINLIQTIALGSGAIPPDHGGAANGKYVLQIVNGGVAVFDRQGKLLSKLKTDSDFWRAAGIPAKLLVNGVSDPRISWDATSQRFYVSQINLDFDPANQVFVAVSKTANPLDGFKAVYFPVKNFSFGDFPTLGVTPDAVTVSTNNFGFFGFQDLSLFSIPKADLLATTPTAARLNRFDTLDPLTYGFALEPADSQDSNDASQDLFAVSATRFFQFQYSRLIDLTDRFAGISTAVPVKTKYDGNPPLGRQPGGTGYDNSDDRIGAKIKTVGNYVYVTNGVSDSQKKGVTKLASQVHWAILDRTTQKIVAEGLIADPARKIDYSYPAIDASASGRFVIGYNGSSATSNISAYATVCDFDQVAVTVNCTAPKLLRYGLDDNYDLGGTRVRWGDYNAVQIDPDNANAFWLFQEYPGYRQLRLNGTFGARWATVITHLVTN